MSSAVAADDFLDGSEVDEYSGMDSDIEDELTWIDWFCSVKGNEFYVEVDEEYIRDDFNLTGLNSMVKNFDRALDIILDEADEDADDEDDGAAGGDSSLPSSAISDAQTLYGLIHARYILTNRGLAAMLEKYNACIFGLCPNIYCNNQPVAPIGLSDRLGQCTANVFCPRCNEVYVPDNSRLSFIDGAFFGTTFPHMFFLQYEHLVLKSSLQFYVPKVFGFSVWRGVKDMLREERAAQAQAIDEDAEEGKKTLISWQPGASDSSDCVASELNILQQERQ